MHQTKAIRTLVFSTIAISIVSALFPVLQQLLALSLSGIHNLFLWQFLTYPLVHAGPLSFSFLLHLAFNMYLLWVFGSSLALYFGAALVSGLVAAGVMYLFNLPYFLAGSSAPLYAVLFSWMICNQGAELLLFFAVPFKAQWLVLGLLGANLLIDLSNGDWVSCASYITAALFGYFFSLAVWKTHSPFSFLRPFERAFFRLTSKRTPKPYSHSKIYDIHSGEPFLEDDVFMDTMLARISLHGEDSLTADEKARMNAISARKTRKK
jgi:membrane associated rhomboid family serine protease